jgi:hypothetical protein
MRSGKDDVASDMDNSGMNKFPETPLLAVPQWPGGHVGCFSLAELAGSPIPMAPFLVLLSYVRRALRRTQPSGVPKRTAKPA